MIIQTFLNAVRAEREYQGILKTIEEQHRARTPLPALVTGLCDGARACFYAALARDVREACGRGFLLILPDEKECARLKTELDALGVNARVYPYRDFIFHNYTASHEYEFERLAALDAAVRGDFDILLAAPDAALQYTMPRARLAAAGRLISYGGQYDIAELAAFAAAAGYTRTELVDGPGQFSVRGGIFDIYPPQCPLPFRAEFFGDEIDQLCTFDILTQRRGDHADSFAITPAREVIAGPDARAELKKIIAAQMKKTPDSRVRDLLGEELEIVTAGGEISFADKYISVIYPEKQCLLDYFDDASLIAAQDANGIAERIRASEWHLRETTAAMLEEGSLPARCAEFSRYGGEGVIPAEGRTALFCETFAASMTGRRLSGIFSFRTKQTVSYADNLELLRDDLGYYLRSGFTAVLMCENEPSARVLRDTLAEDDIPAISPASLTGLTSGNAPASGDAGAENSAAPDAALPKKTGPRLPPVVAQGVPLAGFELTESRFVLMSLCAGHGGRAPLRQPHRKPSKKSSRERIMSYTDLDVGDYVVHQNHGIGQYLGLQSLTHEGVTRDFVKIKYAGTDMLYLPTNQLDMVTKYIGAHADDGSLKLSKMGGAEWNKTKQRAKAAAKNMARELIALYAERLRREGFAFDPDNEMQREFEDAFEYEETDGQLEAAADIKRDMESRVPMDRLLCGDVGFGKTEVALRAAFKAVCSQKQVTILVPTTILALQHYQTILARMRGFPVKADMLSRFRTPKQQQETLRRLRRGEIDILVGTHRIVSNDIQFRDLGLLIVDEEQRFGVAHKEKLKQLAKNVDVLTLTATPIPRTLNMAMSGIRDMSVLEEAPGDRMPVQTYVLEYDDIVIADAIRRELRRGGQVFYLHNRVDNIREKAGQIQAMAPDARIAVAHGQMDKETLSDIWRSLVEGEVDILVSTTIIETGVDIPNANTLIIERADTMGLSQLHQIRGRVGRSSRRAYAYFTYPKGAALSEIAEKRLMAIRDYAEFGSGFKIALRDLEIRGAGNLLGAEQHGHIDSVGYDLYMKILNEAVLEEKGEAAPAKTDCAVELPVSAYLPDSYIRSGQQRIDAYKKVASIENEEDLDDVADELMDRYGEPPRVVRSLLYISLIRALGGAAGFSKIECPAGAILFRADKPDIAAWTRLAVERKGRVLLNVSSKPYLSCRLKKDEDCLTLIADLLKDYIHLRATME